MISPVKDGFHIVEPIDATILSCEPAAMAKPD